MCFVSYLVDINPWLGNCRYRNTSVWCLGSMGRSYKHYSRDCEISMFGLSFLLGLFFVVGNISDLFGNDSSHTAWNSIKSVIGIVLSSLWCIWMVRIIIWLMS